MVKLTSALTLAQTIQHELSLAQFQANALGLQQLERTFCHRDFDASTQFVVKALQEAGFSDVERLEHRCDGQTATLDDIMPEAWDRLGRCYLEIVSPEVPPAERVIADTEVHPFAAAIWSGPTPEGGATGEVVQLPDPLPPQLPDLTGKFVYQNFNPCGERLWRLIKAGMAGMICTIAEQGKIYPDEWRWMNGPGHCGWYFCKEDRKPPIFVLTPRQGAAFEERLKHGKVVVHGVMNTRISDGKIYTVTARIPGDSPREFALFAHLYEPFIPDDATGFAAGVELGRILLELSKQGKLHLKYSLRVVFSMEHYGLGAYLSDPKHARNIFAAHNLDSFCHAAYSLLQQPLELRMSALSLPFFGDLLLDYLLKTLTPELKYYRAAGNLSDDTFGSCPKLDIPTCWVSSSNGGTHHNSGPAFYTADWELARKLLILLGVYCAELTAPDAAELLPLAAELTLAEAQQTLEDMQRFQTGKRPWLDTRAARQAALEMASGRLQSLNRVFPKVTRCPNTNAALAALKTRFALPADSCYDLSPTEYRAANCFVENVSGLLPFSLARIPYAERICTANFLDQPMLFAMADGRHSLLELLKLVKNAQDWAADWTGQQLKEFMDYLELLQKYGYVKITHPVTTTPEQLTKALKKLGVKAGQQIIVHSAFSSLGNFAGGPEAFCKTLMALITPQGTLLMPSFNLYHLDSTNGAFDWKNTPSTIVGAATEAFRKMPGVVRSLDPTHSVAAWGKDQLYFLAHHHQLPTMHHSSPLGLLEQAGGYALLISCPGSVTFMHVVETSNHAPCLGSRTEEYPAILPDGRHVKLRAWGWRNSPPETCPALHELANIDWLRRHHCLAETMLGYAHLMFFKLSDYRRAYEEYLHDPVHGCAQCHIPPRHNEHTLPTDWDDAHDCLLPHSTAFTDDFDLKPWENQESGIRNQDSGGDK